MILQVVAALLAVAPAQKPPTTGPELARDCSAYLSLALGEAEQQGRLDEPLQRAFERWFAEHERLGPGPERAGQRMAARTVDIEREPAPVRAVRTTWCRLNSPAEKRA